MPIGSRLQDTRRNAHERWKQASTYDKTIFVLAALYLLAGGAYLIYRRNFVLPDQFFILALVASLLAGRLKTFLWDWLPLVVLLLGYEYVRGLVPLLNSHVYFQPMIGFDRLFGGTVPTVALQTRFYSTAAPRWYDYAAVTMYLLHFIVPLSVAFLFWLQDRKLFREYGAAILVLSYLAYATYLAYPAAPPWLAAQVGLIPPVQRILAVVLRDLSNPISLPTVYSKLGVNTVAAVPSLHAAYPLLTAIFVGERAPKLLPLMAIYAFGVWAAIVYLGEHYVFDVVAGVIYTVVAYALVLYWPALRAKVRP